MTIAKRYLTKQMVEEPFGSRSLMVDTWGASWGVDTGIGRIKKVLMHRPGEEVQLLHGDAAEIEASSVLSGEIKGRTPKMIKQQKPPKLETLQAQHDALTTALTEQGIEVIPLADGATDRWPERCFARDLGMVIPSGVIASRLALYLRYGETRLATGTWSRINMPLLGTIHGTGFAEGGSFIMLEPKTAVIGRSERVNEHGIEQLKQILSVQDIQLIAVDLPASIIHLDEAFLMVDRAKALVDTRLLPFWFLDELHRRNIELLHVDPEDPPLAINGLCIEPGKVIMHQGAPRTIKLLESYAINVIPVDVSEFFKLGGGIHCLTLPLIRESV